MQGFRQLLLFVCNRCLTKLLHPSPRSSYVRKRGLTAAKGIEVKGLNFDQALGLINAEFNQYGTGLDFRTLTAADDRLQSSPDRDDLSGATASRPKVRTTHRQCDRLRVVL